jgi:uncharacterized protein (DUF305 family)
MPSMSGAMAGHNEQDASFASDMIVHHEGAIEMAKLASSRAADPTVVALASRIEAAQQPEITTMSAWLRAWGMEMPADMAGMHDTMPGMASQADLDKLEAARGPEFDDMFLTMMIEHHEGALTMARSEVSAGANPEAKSLAQKVIADQTAEITKLRGMLSRPPPAASAHGARAPCAGVLVAAIMQVLNASHQPLCRDHASSERVPPATLPRSCKF